VFEAHRLLYHSTLGLSGVGCRPTVAGRIGRRVKPRLRPHFERVQAALGLMHLAGHVPQLRLRSEPHLVWV